MMHRCAFSVLSVLPTTLHYITIQLLNMTHLAAQNWTSIIYPFFFFASWLLASHRSHLCHGHGAARCCWRYCTVLFAWLSSIWNESYCRRSFGQNCMRKCRSKAYIINPCKKRREKNKRLCFVFYSKWYLIVVLEPMALGCVSFI